MQSRPEEFPPIASDTATRGRPGIAVDFAGFLTLLALLAAGPALGLFAWQADRVQTTSFLADVVRGLGNVPSPWLMLAFITGAVIARPLWGGVAGAATLTLAVATYYFAIQSSGDRAGIPLQGAMTGWLAVALIAGPIFGFAGAIWRRGPRLLRPFAVGLLTGAVVGEVAYFAGDAVRNGLWQWGDTRMTLAFADLCLALSLPVLLLRRFHDRVQAYLTGWMTGGVALVVMLWLDEFMLDRFNA